MLFSRETRRKLSTLRRGSSRNTIGRHSVPPDAATEEQSEDTVSEASRWEGVPGPAVAVEELFPGEVLENELGRCYRIRTKESRLREWANSVANAVRAHIPGEVAFVDIETLGLSGLPVFLVGILQCKNRGVDFAQLLARDVTEEAALLVETRRALGAVETLATYNGTTFDLPYLQSRAIYHGLEWRFEGQHTDLLLPARRRFRGRLPNCSLQTLESFVLGREREEDIPSAYIPARYRTFVRSGDARLLEVIVRHNQLDLLALAEIVPHCLG